MSGHLIGRQGRDRPGVSILVSEHLPYKQTTYTIRQEVAYKRLKTMGNNKTVSSVVVVTYERWLITRYISHKITLTPKRTRCFDSYVAIVLICH